MDNPYSSKKSSEVSISLGGRGPDSHAVLVFAVTRTLKTLSPRMMITFLKRTKNKNDP